MATDYSTLSISIDRDRKVLRCAGTIAVKELVLLTITGGAQYIDSGLVLKIQGKNNKGLTTPIAVFPLVNPPQGYANTWTATGTADADAQCYLVLNTQEALEAFENVSNEAFKAFNILIYTTNAPALDANGTISISQFPTGITSDPITLEQADTIAELGARVTAIEADVADSVHQTSFADLDFTDLSTNEKRNMALRALLSRLQGE